MCPDLETFFHKMLFSIFFLENASQIGLRIPEVIDSLPYQKQRSQKSASGNERPLTQGGGGNPVLRTLGVGCSEAPLGRSAPGAPPARRGSPFLPRNGEKEGRGQAPWTPGFMARLLPLARFGVCATLSRWRGYYGTHVRALIWRLSFIKCFFSIFFPENAFQIGLRIPEEIAPRTDPGQQPPKPASANERAINQGGRGATPRDSLRPGFL